MSTTQEIQLTGLIGSNPLGALAAFGLLRVCSEIPEIINPRLFWRLEDDWIAMLAISNTPSLDEDRLIDLLLLHLSNFNMNDIFGWSKDINEAPTTFKEHLWTIVKKSSWDNRLIIDFFSSFASEMAVTVSNNNKIKPSAFYMVRNDFLKSINKKIANSLKSPKRTEKSGADAFKEAIFGPWEYQDVYHSLGWDPSTERIYALQHYNPGAAPNNEAKASCVRAAVWLAAQALPFFPVLPTAKGQLLTTGFSGPVNKEPSFIWPIWENPVSVNTLKSLLVSSELTKQNNEIDFVAKRGITAIFQSVRSPYGKGSAVFRPATIKWMAS